LTHGVKLAGATVHWVTEDVDSGPILAQVAVPVYEDDDEQSLFARIQVAEKPLYVDTIRRLCKEIPHMSEPGAPKAHAGRARAHRRDKVVE